MPDAWDTMPLTGRIFTALLVLSMGMGSINGHIFFMESVHQGVLNTMFRR